MRALVLFAVIVAWTGPAHAEQQALEFAQPQAAGKARPLSHRITENVNVMVDEVTEGVRHMTFDLVDMNFDLSERRARLRLGGEFSSKLALRVNSDVKFHGSRARVKAKVDLALVGHKVHLDLPDFDVVSSSVFGQRIVEFQMPLFQHHF